MKTAMLIVFMLATLASATEYEYMDTINYYFVDEDWGTRMDNLTCTISIRVPSTFAIKNPGIELTTDNYGNWYLIYNETMTYYGNGEYIYQLPPELTAGGTYYGDTYCGDGGQYHANYGEEIEIKDEDSDESVASEGGTAGIGDWLQELAGMVAPNEYASLKYVDEAVSDVGGNMKSYSDFVKGVGRAMETAVSAPITFIQKYVIGGGIALIAGLIKVFFLFFMLVEFGIMVLCITKNPANPIRLIQYVFSYNTAFFTVLFGFFVTLINVVKIVFDTVITLMEKAIHTVTAGLFRW